MANTQATAEEYLANKFWIKKMKTAFKLSDVDKNGVINIEDFKRSADLFEKKCPEKAKEIREQLIHVFIESTGSADTQITLNQWLKMRAAIAAHPDARKRFREFMDKEFDLIDTDGSGTISREEFRDFFECKGLDGNLANPSFDAIDTDHNNFISRDEFSVAREEFHLGLDETHSSQIFYGPLLDD